uniref:hypothetical protein n=1 Tax=Staphylococcus epidermidis TaxID=1282 RepID=UPI0021B30A6E
MEEFEKEEEEMKGLERFVEKNISGGCTSGMGKSRGKRLEKMEGIDKGMIDGRSGNIEFGLEGNSGNDVMEIDDLKIG